MRKVVLTLFVIIFMSATINALNVEGNSKDICVNLGDVSSLNIQFEPEINTVYTAVKNTYNRPISLTTNLSVVDLDSMKVINTITLNVSNLQPNQTVCNAPGNLKLPNSFRGSFFIEDLEIFPENESEPLQFYNQLIENFSLKITKSLSIDSWKRDISTSYLMNSAIKDEIFFRKLAEGEMTLHIPIKNENLAHLNIDYVYLSFDSKTIYPQFYNPSGSGEIVILLDKSLPLDEKIKLELSYSTGDSSHNNFLYLYPLSSWFTKISSPPIGSNNPYIEINSTRENLTDIDFYSVEMNLPEGYEYKSIPEEYKLESSSEENSGIKMFSSDCGCFKEDTVCIVPIAYGLTPKPIIEPNKILWSSPIVNNAPQGLVFYIKDVGLYRFVFFILLIISSAYFFSCNKIKDRVREIEIMILYLSMYLLIRLSLKIPLEITLFEIVALITILRATLVWYLIK